MKTETDRAGGADREAPGSRRAEVLAISAALFASRGFHGTSTRDIARACHIRPGSLYSHVDSKDQLLLELTDRFYDEIILRKRQAASGDGSGAERLARVIRATVHACRSMANEFLAMTDAWNYMREHPLFSPVVVKRWEAQDVTIGVLRDGIEDGSLRPDIDPTSVCWILDSTVLGMVDRRYHRAATAGASTEADPPLDTLLAIAFDGLRPGRPGASAVSGPVVSSAPQSSPASEPDHSVSSRRGTAGPRRRNRSS